MEDKIINDIKKIYPDYDIKVGASVFRSDVFRVYLEKDGVKKSILYKRFFFFSSGVIYNFSATKI